MQTSTKIKLFDFSNYPKDSKYYNDSNNLVKDQTFGLTIKGFIGLKSKKYTFMIEDNLESKKSKRH